MESMSDKEFEARYGVTPQQVQDALDDNRGALVRRMREWGYAWAVDEIMCDVAVDLLRGGLARWAAYEDRKPLAAFVNALLTIRVGEWMRTDRPKYRAGMTHAPGGRHSRPRRAAVAAMGALDADEARRRLRETAREGAPRLCEEDDVFGGPDTSSTGATAGDRSSYRAWVTAGTGGDEAGPLASDLYKADLEYLKTQVERAGGREAWGAFLRQCLTTRSGPTLRRETRRFLEHSRRGLAPRIRDYPGILGIVARAEGRKTITDVIVASTRGKGSGKTNKTNPSQGEER